MHCGTSWECVPETGCNAFVAPDFWDFTDRCGGMYSHSCFSAGKCEKVRDIVIECLCIFHVYKP